MQLVGSNQLNLSGDKQVGQKKKSEVLVKMAAYNEAMTIGSVLKKMPENVDVLVIDDGSTDSTRKISSDNGAMVITHPINMGQGIADLTGFKFAMDQGYEIAIEMDADGQHDPQAIENFISELKSNEELDFVVGSRILGSQEGKVDSLRKTFLPLYTKLINWASGYRLTDAMCGFKAFRMSSLAAQASVLEQMHETEYIAAEMFIRFGKAGMKVSEIPVTIRQREHGVSHKGSLRYGLAVAWIIIRTLFNSGK